MGNDGGIKAWVRKHSPIKNRNKPLPASPPTSSSTRCPIKDISGNVSLTKQPTNKMRFILEKTLSRTGSLAPGSLQRRRSQYQPTEGQIPQSPSRDLPSQRGQSIDLQRLSQKVANLEAELCETRKELDSVVGTARHSSRARSVEHEGLVYSNHRHKRARSQGRYDGLVESLLEERDNSLRARNTSLRGLAGDSSLNVARAGGQNHAWYNEELLERYDNTESHVAVQLKRKRTAVPQAFKKQTEGPVVKVRTFKRLKYSQGQDLKKHDTKPIHEQPKAREPLDLRHKQLPETPKEEDGVRVLLPNQADQVCGDNGKSAQRYYVQRRFCHSHSPETTASAESLKSASSNPDRWCSTTSPSALQTVAEEFEWDEEVF